MKLSVMLLLLLLISNVTQFPTPETFPLPYGKELHCDKDKCWLEKEPEDDTEN